MKHPTTIIIGAGHSGLAMGRELTLAGVDHVILERGQVANSWRKERWDSLRLLTPNWMNGLHGHDYNGNDHDGYMHVDELIDSFDICAAKSGAPVQTETTVLSVNGTKGAYTVQTDQGAMYCDSLVMANGACATPKIPDFASQIPEQIQSFTPQNYKRPAQLPDGKVLVVGASASGMQLPPGNSAIWTAGCSGRRQPLTVPAQLSRCGHHHVAGNYRCHDHPLHAS